MNISQVTGIYFSPTGQTKQLTELLLSNFSCHTQALDLTVYAKRPAYHFEENEAVIVAAPVFAGRIPETAVRRFRALHGNRTPAVIIVTYGNRGYDNALVELSDVLKEQGFIPAAAAALVARHSMIPEIAADRPNQDDESKLKDFASGCMALFKDIAGSSSITEPLLPGIHPKDPPEQTHLKIKASGACTGCGTCIRECPEQAISRTDPRIMDEDRCTSCMRCIALCPSGARSLSSQAYRSMKHMLKKVCSEPKESEFFIR